MILKQKQKHCKSSLIKVISSEKNSFRTYASGADPRPPEAPETTPPPPAHARQACSKGWGKG